MQRTLILMLVLASCASYARAGERILSDTSAANFEAKPFFWENVTNNDPATNPPALQAYWNAGPNYNIGTAWTSAGMTVDPSAMRVKGITWHMTGTAGDDYQNYYPAIRQGTKYYRRPGNHGYDFNGTGPHTFDCGNDWIEIFDGTKGGGIGDMVVADSVPNFGNGGASISFGFIQWGGSSGGSVNATAQTRLTDLRYVIETRDNTGTIALYDAAQETTAENPSKQMWRERFTDGDVAEAIEDGGVKAWRLRDNSSDDAPMYQTLLSAQDFEGMYLFGWEFEFRVKAVASGQFIGWGLTAATDPGWGLATRERVGFGISRSGADFIVNPIHGAATTLTGEGDQFHTIRCVGQAGASTYEFFLDGASQGTFDIKDGTSNSSFDNLLSFTSGSSGGTGLEAYWNKVSLGYTPVLGSVMNVK